MIERHGTNRIESRICKTCRIEKPLDQFRPQRRQCSACRAGTRNVWNPDQRERQRHAEQVQINRLINSIPVPR